MAPPPLCLCVRLVGGVTLQDNRPITGKTMAYTPLNSCIDEYIDVFNSHTLLVLAIESPLHCVPLKPYSMCVCVWQMTKHRGWGVFTCGLYNGNFVANYIEIQFRRYDSEKSIFVCVCVWRQIWRKIEPSVILRCHLDDDSRVHQTHTVWFQSMTAELLPYLTITTSRTGVRAHAAAVKKMMTNKTISTDATGNRQEPNLAQKIYAIFGHRSFEAAVAAAAILPSHWIPFE